MIRSVELELMNDINNKYKIVDKSISTIENLKEMINESMEMDIEDHDIQEMLYTADMWER